MALLACLARRFREETNDALVSRWLDDLVQDLRYAVRALAKHKGFTTTAVATLALGIGANTAIFSVVNGVVLRPLPFAEPDRLVQLYSTNRLTSDGAVAWADLEEFRSQSTSLDGLVGYATSARYLKGSGGSEQVMTVPAERGLFSLLGVRPIAGRTFQSDDPQTVAVVGEAFWSEHGRDPSIIGRAVTLDDEPYTIIGVMPESFQFPYGAASAFSGVASEARIDLWIPFAPPTAQRARVRSSVVGRLKGSVTLSAAQTELALIARRLALQNPGTNGDRSPAGELGARLVPLSEVIVPVPIRRPLFVLLGAVVSVLLLACANVANLSLVRMSVRAREVAVRAALGAGPFRLLRQFLTESLLLSLAGGALGLGLAWWGTGFLMGVSGAHIPRARDVGLDWRVFLFLLAVCAGSGVAFGLAPAIIGMRTNPHSVLQESGGHATMAVGPRRLRDTLVIIEFALAFILAVGAMLLVRELVRLKNTDLGLVSRNVLTYHVGQRMTPRTDVRQFYEIAERVAQLPGVRAAGFTQLLPLQNWGWTSNSTDFRLRGRPAPQPAVFPIELRYVTPGYFQALDIPIRKGRAFTVRDDRDSPPVILINETLARRHFGNEDPVSMETTRGTIVGVVGDVRQVNLDRSAEPEIYYPIAQNWSQLSQLGMSLVVRTEGRPEPLIDAIRSVIREVNPNHAVFNVRTMDRVVTDSLANFTMFLLLMASFAALALLLAATGIYGMLSYVATSRMRELAIRVALGADRTHVSRMVLGQGMRLTAIGLGFGVCGALAAAPLLRNLPVTVRPPDIVMTASVAALLGAVAVAACLLPARRAARVDPLLALRQD